MSKYRLIPFVCFVVSAIYFKTATTLTWNTSFSGTPNDPFQIGFENGFLPTKIPLATLPEKYHALETLLQEMPVVKKNRNPGLLSGKDNLFEAVKTFPLLDVSAENDTHVLAALFRDYSFLASGYIFEPSHHHNIEKGQLGLARPILPRQISVPFVQVAKRLKVRPFMDYAHAYALNNWKLKDPYGGRGFENLDLIRSFTGNPSEIGFVLVHIRMDHYSGKLIQGAIDFLTSVENNDEDACGIAMECLLDSMRHINQEMDKMWTRNNHKDYNLYRTFIMGIKSQPILPNGLIYEGVSEEPQFYRGESGACDSIIPLMDNILELTLEMPDNELTAILKEFRACRPKNHEGFLKWIEEKSTNLKMKEFAVTSHPLLLLKLLDQVREFRTRHWQFVNVYIIQHTKYPVATGGSPIIKWLPNQLLVVHKEIQKVIMDLRQKGNESGLNQKEIKFCDKLLELSENEVVSLERRVEELTADFNKSNQSSTYN